jgi:two-component system, OmpR family, response regulator protein BraR/BceR
MQRIMIVEDDVVIARTLHQQLTNWGYEVFVTTNFATIVTEFTRFVPQLILLDIMLPGQNGFIICDDLRKLSKVPIVFISSASDNFNIMLALEKGGDDFIAKPFDINVLHAKIQAILRRTYNYSVQSHLIAHAGYMLDLAESTFSYEGNRLELTKTEMKIMQLLMENSGTYVERETIMTRLWQSDCFVDENTLSVYVARLRKKLETVNLNDVIETKKGVGYMVK